MAKKRKTVRKPAKAQKKNSNELFNRNLKKETTNAPLFGIKIITLAILLLSLYSFVMLILYILSFFIGGPLRDYMLTGVFDKDYFINAYGKVKAENFLLLMGTFTSMITFTLGIWFSFALWKKKNWARITIGFLSLIIFIIFLFDFIFAGLANSFQIILLVISGIIALYLFLNKNVIKAY